MSIQEKQLGQSNPGSTPAAIYTLPAATTVIAKSIMVCNTSASTKTYSVYHDEAGSTYTAAKALIYGDTLLANESKLVDLFAAMSTVGGTIGVSGSTTDVTFTLYGAELT